MTRCVFLFVAASVFAQNQPSRFKAIFEPVNVKADVIDLCIKNATINAKKGEVRIGGYSPVVSLATFESGRWNG